MRCLEKPALTPESPSASFAQALVGKIAFTQEMYEEAVTWWQAMDLRRRQQWQLEEPLRATVFVRALQAMQVGQYEKAADKLREAGRLGLRDRRLTPLLTLALVKAGQQLLYLEPNASSGIRNPKSEIRNKTQ